VGFLPFFDEEVLAIITEYKMKSADWAQFTKLSFVRTRGDGTWELHDLAKNLVTVELGDGIKASATKVSESLAKAYSEKDDFRFLALSLSAKAHYREKEAIDTLKQVVEDLIRRGRQNSAFSLLRMTRLQTDIGKDMVNGLRGTVFAGIYRVAEARRSIKESMEIVGQHIDSLPVSEKSIKKRKRRGMTESAEKSDELLKFIEYRIFDEAATSTVASAWVLWENQKQVDAVKTLRDALKLYEKLSANAPTWHTRAAAYTLNNLARIYKKSHRLVEGRKVFDDALVHYKKLATEEANVLGANTANALESLVLRPEIPRDEYEDLMEELEEFGIMGPLDREKSGST
jgi:tetratricopeptide (TPR) repeat protein